MKYLNFFYRKSGNDIFRRKKKERNRVNMMFNIMVGVLGLFAVAAGVFAWKLENGSFGEEEDSDGGLETVIGQRKDEENE